MNLLNIFLNGYTNNRQTKHVVMDRLKRELSLEGAEEGFVLDYGQESDLIDIVDLEVLGYQGYLAWRFKDFEYDFKRNPHCVYLLLRRKTKSLSQQGPLVGIVHGRFKANGAHISHLIVHPDYQGHGHGKFLLNKWLEAVKLMGIPKVTLECRKSNLTAHKLYIQAGFRQIGLKHFYYSDNNEDALEMEYRL